MATLTVWRFTTPGAADSAIDTLLDLQKQELVTVVDAATVSWAEGDRRPTTRQLNDMTGKGALGGAFWGLLMTSDAVLDKVHDAFAGQHAELIHTNLSDDQEQVLRNVFA